MVLEDGALGGVGAAVGTDGLDLETVGVDFGDGVEGLLVADALALKVLLCGVEEGLFHAEAAFGLELVEPGLDLFAGRLSPAGYVAAAVDAVGEEPEEALEVG